MWSFNLQFVIDKKDKTKMSYQKFNTSSCCPGGCNFIGTIAIEGDITSNGTNYSSVIVLNVTGKSLCWMMTVLELED